MPDDNDRLPMTTDGAFAFAHGGGVMGQRLRTHDWNATPLGHPSGWPASLRTAVGMVLNSRFPSAVVWGPGLTTIHNDAFTPILGAKPPALGRSFRDIWSEAWDVIGPIAERAFQGEATFIEDFPLVVERNGYAEHAYFTFCYSPVRDESGAVAGMIDTVVETTATVRARNDLAAMNTRLEAQVEQRTREREEALDALRQAQKMEALGQLTGGVAHDFNNLLQAIGGSMELIDRRLAAGRTDVSPYVRAVRQSVDRAAAMTQRLLAFARRQPLQPRSVDLNGLVTGMADLLRRSVGGAVRVDLWLDHGLPCVWGDANQIESALLNLAINARDAMPDGGVLTIATAAAPPAEEDGDCGPGVMLSVSDTGMGMNPDVLARAVEPFFTTKPIGQGTGLGLSQIYGFVHQSGGRLHIGSTEGMGTTVTITLPCARREEGAAPHAPDAATAEAAAAATLLLVEDEALVRLVFATALGDQGYTVLEAGDGPSALDLLTSDTAIDLLVTDVGLPGMNGRQVAEAGRRLRPGLKVLFLTGYAHKQGIQDETLGPDTQLLGKPVTTDALLARVASMLAGGV
ncbi:signal transduction histidine kinase [Azospirillum fermentarium]|uniref:ATP-binding protein n=1 Tax=Azospirillum fermentarium TaxID=1233114 RepID=UPI0022270079|nr:ATP-binding protein [Azospirillum fermentarium]MCW2245959.1 signal transduction histidine kinase [Azospirillum fermentarium]